MQGSTSVILLNSCAKNHHQAEPVLFLPLQQQTITGRSLSAFKRDFKTIFNETPNRWLIKRRLQEARILIEEKKQKPVDIYLDLGFEDLSHFYFVFKKEFGMSPSEINSSKRRR